MTAAIALAASTLTAPPGRSTLATVPMAAAGESTYSSTLWQSTRSAPCSPMTAARSPTSPWTARNRTLISAARRCAAASESGLGSITVTVCPCPARGTADPPVPPPASTMSSFDRPVSATSPVTTARSTSRMTAVRASSYRFHRCGRACPGRRARPRRHLQPSATTLAGHGPSSLTVGSQCSARPRQSPRSHDPEPVVRPAGAGQNLRDPLRNAPGLLPCLLRGLLRVPYRAAPADPAALPGRAGSPL